jgi:hypothetical protein
MSDDSKAPEPAPGTEPPPLPPKPDFLGRFMVGAALAIVAGFTAYSQRLLVPGLLGIPLVGVALTAFPRTQAYGFGVLVAYGLSALIALAICGYTFTHMGM